MEAKKFYTLEEIEDKYIGEKGTPKRDAYEEELNAVSYTHLYPSTDRLPFPSGPKPAPLSRQGLQDHA